MIELLSASLWRPFALAAVAWVFLRVFRVRHPASRHAVWTGVLIGMLLLPMVSVTAPHWNVPVPPSKPTPTRVTVVPTVAPAALAIEETVESEPFPDRDGSETVAAPVKPMRGRVPFPVESAVLYGYLAGVLAMFAYRAVGWVLLRRVMIRSSELDAPWLRESGDVATPVAAGVLRPAVLLPANWREWSDVTRKAVLAHEFAHIRRHDALVSALARFMKCVLWFHPLAWWVSRQISELAELACDAEALETVGDPAMYSRILMEFAAAVSGAGHRATLPGLALASPSGMARRIDAVFEMSGGRMKKLARPALWLAAMGMPVMCFAATVGLGESMALPVQRLVLQIAMPEFPVITAARPAPVLVAQAPVQTPVQTPGPPAVNPPVADASPAYSVEKVDPERRIDAGANFYSVEKEKALGAELAAQLTRNAKVLDAPAMLEYVNRLGQKLAAQMPEGRFPYTFAVVAMDTNKVFEEPIALPGGYIFVQSSLLLAAQDETELAGMLAHAMAHVAARHGTRQMTKASTAQMAMIPLSFYGGWAGFGVRQTSSTLIPLSLLQFSNVYEQEADRIAVKVTLAAGYDPRGLVRYLGRTLPPERREARIADIERAIRDAAPASGPANDEFQRIKRQIPDPRGAEPADVPPADAPRLKRLNP